MEIAACICLLVDEKLWMDFDEIFYKCQQWHTEQMMKVWW